MFLINVGVYPFLKNHNRNLPEPAKNLAEQTEKTIANLAETVSDTKTIKNKDNERGFAKLRCLTVFRGFFQTK